MNKEISTAAMWIMLFLIGAPLHSSAQETQGYTFLTGPSGPRVCLGRWIPPTDPALPGSCDGQLMDLGQFSAVSSRLTADRLDQAVNVLSSIDQRLSMSNEQLLNLVSVVSNLQKTVERQTSQDGLTDAIEKRFDALPSEILSNDMFRQEMRKLKEDILKEVESRMSAKPAPSSKQH